MTELIQPRETVSFPVEAARESQSEFKSAAANLLPPGIWLRR